MFKKTDHSYNSGQNNAHTESHVLSNGYTHKKTPIQLVMDQRMPDPVKRGIISKQLEQYESRMFDRIRFGRKDLINFLKKFFGLSIIYSVATEGIFFCRGEKLEKSSDCDRDKLLDWLILRLPTLLIFKERKEQTKKERKETVHGHARFYNEPEDAFDEDLPEIDNRIEQVINRAH